MLCRRCAPGWLAAVNHHKENRKFKKGATIFREGDPVEGIFFVYDGKVKIHKRWGSDKDLIVRFARAGDILGYRGLGNELVYPISATALEEVIVCFFNMQFFESTLRVNPDFTYDLMKFYANELQEAERRMRNLVHMEAKGRVAETLLMLKDTFGVNEQGAIDITLTKQDMASYAGTTYETFSRMTNELIKEKIIKVSGKDVSILKEKNLRLLTLSAD
jgi:CRP-like cAMP-binding protein